MENFSTVLWIVVIAAAMIFNVVSQSRKQAKKQARQAGSGHTAHLSGRGNAPKDRLTAAEHPHAAYDDAQEDVSAEIAEDFDLRRAVIYSEILKPKFDE